MPSAISSAASGISQTIDTRSDSPRRSRSTGIGGGWSGASVTGAPLRRRPRPGPVGTGSSAPSASGPSQISRESKDCAESIVKITDRAKVMLAGPGVIEANTLNCTSDTLSATTKTSIIDQRPIYSTIS